MNLTFGTAGKNTIVSFSGELDEHSVRKFRDRLDERLKNVKHSVVIFDFSGVSFVDSTGLGLILGRYKKLSAVGSELVVSNVPPQVDKVFRASGVYSVCPKIN